MFRRADGPPTCALRACQAFSGTLAGMGTKAHGRMLFWEGASLWILSAPPGQRYPRTAPHRHHVVQVTVALTGTIDFEGQGTRVAGEVVAIAPDSLHAFEGTGLVAHVFIDSDSRQGRQIAQRLFCDEPIVRIPASQLDTLPQNLKTAFEVLPRRLDDGRSRQLDDGHQAEWRVERSVDDGTKRQRPREPRGGWGAS